MHSLLLTSKQIDGLNLMSQGVHCVVDYVGKHNGICLINSANDIKYQWNRLLAIRTLLDRHVNRHLLAKLGTQVEPEITVRTGCRYLPAKYTYSRRVRIHARNWHRDASHWTLVTCGDNS